MKQFKAQSKKLMDMMINSIYTNKDIFLRELISNASDAIDKRHFLSLTNPELATEFEIQLIPNREARSLTVTDNGAGMSKEELENNLGTIAASGTLKFKQEQKTDENLIGQFGVGFYSAFMVASRVEVVSRQAGGESAYKWTSSGAQGYEIEECQKEDAGTSVTLWLKENDEDCAYSDYLSEYKLRNLVTTYSDYIRYPIVMEVTKSKKEENAEGYTEFSEKQTLNSMTPIWKKGKNEVKKEDYDAFYRSRFHDFRAPVRTLRVNIEGAVNYTALLFIPEKQPAGYYSKEYKKGLCLYSNGVLIQEKCEQLLPDFLGFVKGVVDSPDLSLNVSREILQQDRQLKFIASSLLKKIQDDMKKWLKNDREQYEKFFKELGEGIKYGVYENFGEKKDSLKDLVLFYSSTEKKPTLLSEYVSRMPQQQEGIYFACGDSVQKTDKLPQLEALKESGTEILYCTQPVDEFCLMALGEYDGKKFVNALKADAVKDKEKQEEKQSDDGKELLQEAEKLLKDKVSKVRLSSRLKSHACCLATDGEISLEMERVLRASGEGIKADRVLELNPNHRLYGKLQLACANDKPLFEQIVRLLYDEAALMAVGEVDDPAAFVSAINALIEKE